MKSLLSDNFFSILDAGQARGDASKFVCRVKLDPSHPVYGGHFPGNPVAPGVCLIQMIKEVLENHTDRELMMPKMDEVKFMSIVNPEKDTILDMDITLQTNETGDMKANVLINAGGQTYLKFRGTFSAQQ